MSFYFERKMLFSKKTISLLGLTATMTLSGCVTTGGAGTAATGAAAGATVVNANSGLERCDVPFGTLVIDDNRDKEWYGDFRKKTKVSTIEPLIRLTVMQSNCFVITSSGNRVTDEKIRMISHMQRNSDEFRANSNQQAGQRVASDYFMEAAIVINNEPASSMTSGAMKGLSGGIGGFITGGITGSLMSKVEQKSSVVTMTLFDIRSGIQLSMAEGNSTASNFSAALNVFGDGASASLSGFSRTPEGKATVAAFVDAYNGMVVALRSYKAQEVKGGLGRGGQLTVAD